MKYTCSNEYIYLHFVAPLIPISALGSKPRVDLSLACILACVLFLRFISGETPADLLVLIVNKFPFVIDVCDPLRQPPNGRISYNLQAINGKYFDTTEATLTCNSGYHIPWHALNHRDVSGCQIRSCLTRRWYPNAITACAPSNGILLEYFPFVIIIQF